MRPLLASLTDVLEHAVEFYSTMDRDPLASRVRAALEIYVSSLTCALSGWVVTGLARTAERRWKELAAADA